MTLYSIALFLHIVGALLLFALLAVEGASMVQGKSAARFNQVLGPLSLVFILFPGLYMVATTWGWKGWIVVGVTSWLLIAIVGTLTGVLLLRQRLSVGAASVSWAGRVGLATGVVFVMTVKPEVLVALAAVVIGAIAGVAAVGLAIRRPPRAEA